MTNFVQLKKGQQVFEVSDWDGCGTYYIRHLEVKSCGKVQMTAFEIEDDDMARQFFYANPETGYSRFYDAMEYTVEQLTEMYIGKATTVRAEALAYADSEYARTLAKFGPDHHATKRELKRVAKCSKPARVITFAIALEEITERIAADREAGKLHGF